VSEIHLNYFPASSYNTQAPGSRDMNFSLPIRLALGAALALLLAPSIGKASCGDYLTPGVAVAHQSAAMPDHPAPAIPKPCDGPNCRQAPPVLPIAPAAPVVIGADDWACGTNIGSAEPDSSSRRATDFAAMLPARHPSAIFHPPRRISA